MGKGGTRFVGDAVAVRGKSKGYTSKDQKKDMETFLATGVHPEVERARAAQQEIVPPLPERSTQRHHVFMDIAVNGQVRGRLVIELFDDIAPVAAMAFRNRCSEGASDTFKGTAIHKIVRDMGAFGGQTARYREGVHMKRYPELRHSEEGLASISLQGAEFGVTLGRALGLDTTHQVVGRLSAGRDLLPLLNAIKTDVNDAPQQHRVKVARCGFTDAAGTLEDFDEAGAGAGGNKAETAEEAAARVKLEAAKARESVREALQTGLGASGSKRKQPEGGSSGGGGKPAAKKGMLDSMLGDISSSDEEEDEEEEE